jgi:diguanylate cyclase (GGDEF)-like protein
MKFPVVSDIVTKDVISVDMDASIELAISKMLESEHRTIIVIQEDEYYILGIMEIMKLQQKGIALDMPLSSLMLQKVPTIQRSKNILDTLEYVREGIEYICVLNADESLFGLITNTDIISNIDPHTLMDNYKLSDFIKLGKRMKWITKEQKVKELIDDMSQGVYDNVIVVDENKPIGILTTKDIILLLKKKKDLDKSVTEYMSQPVEVMHRDASIRDAIEFTQTKHYKRVVVVEENGDLAGVINQKELISLTYSKWALLMKEYHEELHEINKILENKNKEYEVRASTDSLTGLYNRYKFSELFINMYKDMIQRDGVISLIMLDVDHFKQVNDQYGHLFGDKVLVEVANTLVQTLRNFDIVCRWGGEEFVALLPTSSIENSVEIANKLRIAIQSISLDNGCGISASFGVSEVLEGDDIDSAVLRADKALYHAKSSGRNCVKIYN